MEPKVILIIVGCIISILNSGVPGYVTYNLRKSDEINQIPFNFLKICHFCFVSWLVYSVALVNTGLILVNGICSVTSFGSLFIYAFYSKKLWEFYPQYLVSSLLVVSISLSLIRIDALGLACTIFNVVTSLSLLESIYQVYATKNYTYIDITMAISNFISGIVWNFYGFLISNFPIIISNTTLIIISLALIAFHMFYRLKYKNKAYI